MSTMELAFAFSSISLSSFHHQQTPYKFNHCKHIPVRFFVHSELIHHSTIPSLNSTVPAAVIRVPTIKRKWAKGIDLDALCKEGRLKEALGILYFMNQRGIPVDFDTYDSLLQACINRKALAEGKRVHAHMLANGFDQNLCLGTKLVTMYAMCGGMIDARLVFDKLFERNVFLWNALIRGYAWNGPFEESFILYCQMRQAGIQPDSCTFPFVLKACAGLAALQLGKEVHCHIAKTGFESDVFVGNALIDMYTKCGKIETARQLFDKMSTRDLVTWNAMIAGYVQSGQPNEALTLFHQTHLAGVKPSWVTIVSVLRACAHLADLQKGKDIHEYIVKNGLESQVSIGIALVDMYSKCGCIGIARRLFDKMSKEDVVLWNAMIAGHGHNGYYREALEFFRQMQLVGVKPNQVTIVSVFPACTDLAALQQGRELHNYVIKNGFESHGFVRGALIDMYAKCESIDIARRVFDKIPERDLISWNAMIAGYAKSGVVEAARQLFDKMPDRNLISWNAMIAGYAQNGHANDALTVFHQMQLAEVKPDSVTMVSLLTACALLAALQHGKSIHNYIIKGGFKLDVSVETALLNMYAKCGSLQVARQVFDKMCERDVVSWNSMITGYGMHGHGEDALALLFQMQQTGMMPDPITFVGVLSACSHAGMVDEGWQTFGCMNRDYGITPTVEHYACMVDLLGRAGQLNEAQNLIKRMPIEPDACVWGSLLGACRIHCNVELGKCVAEHLLELEPNNAGNYVLLSNIYAAAGRWDDVAKVRTMLKGKQLNQSPGCSWIEIRNRVHEFVSGDKSHPQSDKIYAMLDSLDEPMKEAGYVPDTSFVLQDVKDKEKERILFGHSERLAIAFGLINTSVGTPIQISKNLRVCGDCHSATKFISKIAKREIIVRDANRFHHFKNGLCSCGDYW